MSTPESDEGYYVLTHSAAPLSASMPMSVNASRTLFNNAAALYESSCLQHRINDAAVYEWVLFHDSVSLIGTMVGETVSSDEWYLLGSYDFPWTLLHDGRPATPVLRVGGRKSTAAATADMTVKAVLLPGNEPINPEPEEAWATWSGMLTVSHAWAISASAVIDDEAIGWYEIVGVANAPVVGGTTGGEYALNAAGDGWTVQPTRPAMAMGRLDLFGKASTGGAGRYVVVSAVHLRELFE